MKILDRAKLRFVRSGHDLARDLPAHLRRLGTERRGDGLLTHAMLGLAGLASVGVMLPSMFQSGQIAADTVKTQAQALQNGANGSGGSSSGSSGLSGLGGSSGFSLSCSSGNCTGSLGGASITAGNGGVSGSASAGGVSVSGSSTGGSISVGGSSGTPGSSGTTTSNPGAGIVNNAGALAGGTGGLSSQASQAINGIGKTQ